MFLRVRAKKENKTAFVALIRKMLTIIWRLLVNSEKFVANGFEKITVKSRAVYDGHGPLEQMAELRSAGYIVFSGLSG
jgi:hypothetical protein